MKILEKRINFRYLSAGGPMLDKPEMTSAVLRARNRLILLVHGYNTSRDDADGVYGQFADRISRVAPQFSDDLCAVYWAGDEANSILSRLSYPNAVGSAIAVAKPISNFLGETKTDWQSAPHLVFVAHSLGCRVILETLLQLFTSETDITVDVVLLAAAVPDSLLADLAPLRNALAKAPRRLVLHSSSDDVLGFLFRVGERLVGESGEAVGLNGRPVFAWSNTCSMSGYKHRDYWGSEEVAEIVAHWLGASVPMPIKRVLISPRLLPPDHALASDHVLAPGSVVERREGIPHR